MSYKDIKSFEQECKDKDAEIERLKANIIWLEARNKALTEMRLEDKALITELCEALEYPSEVRAIDLFQRARGATR